jgi:UDP-N-acetylglucosamine 1-carboxyvinyltransferase
MDRIRIIGGSKLNGTIPISGAKNAALPLMIAGLLSEETLVLDNVPRLADVAQLQRILGNHGVDITSLGKRSGDHALRTGVADARELLGDRAAAGADA